MINTEGLLQGLLEICDDDVAEMVADEIGCPSSPECAYK